MIRFQSAARKLSSLIDNALMRWLRKILMVIPPAVISIVAWADESPTSIRFVDVFTGGKGGYPAYRIPSLIATTNGTLLAFAEARASLRDHAENDIVLK